MGNGDCGLGSCSVRGIRTPCMSLNKPWALALLQFSPYPLLSVLDANWIEQEKKRSYQRPPQPAASCLSPCNQFAAWMSYLVQGNPVPIAAVISWRSLVPDDSLVWFCPLIGYLKLHQGHVNPGHKLPGRGMRRENGVGKPLPQDLSLNPHLSHEATGTPEQNRTELANKRKVVFSPIRFTSISLPSLCCYPVLPMGIGQICPFSLACLLSIVSGLFFYLTLDLTECSPGNTGYCSLGQKLVVRALLLGRWTKNNCQEVHYQQVCMPLQGQGCWQIHLSNLC